MTIKGLTSQVTTTELEKRLWDNDLAAQSDVSSLDVELSASVKLQPVSPLKELTATKHDSGKPDLTLLPSEALLEIAKVLEFGAGKYGRSNWKLGFVWSRPAAAAMRHLLAWIGGEDKDPETGLSHLAHCACSIMFLLTFEVKGIGKDNRRE